MLALLCFNLTFWTLVWISSFKWMCCYDYNSLTFWKNKVFRNTQLATCIVEKKGWIGGRSVFSRCHFWSTHPQLWCGHGICGWCKTSKALDWLSYPNIDTASRSLLPWKRWEARGQPTRKACLLLPKNTASWRSRGKRCPPKHSATDRGTEDRVEKRSTI